MNFQKIMKIKSEDYNQKIYELWKKMQVSIFYPFFLFIFYFEKSLIYHLHRHHHV